MMQPTGTESTKASVAVPLLSIPVAQTARAVTPPPGVGGAATEMQSASPKIPPGGDTVKCVSRKSSWFSAVAGAAKSVVGAVDDAATAAVEAVQGKHRRKRKPKDSGQETEKVEMQSVVAETETKKAAQPAAFGDTEDLEGVEAEGVISGAESEDEEEALDRTSQEGDIVESPEEAGFKTRIGTTQATIRLAVKEAKTEFLRADVRSGSLLTFLGRVFSETALSERLVQSKERISSGMSAAISLLGSIKTAGTRAGQIAKGANNPDINLGDLGSISASMTTCANTVSKTNADLKTLLQNIEKDCVDVESDMLLALQKGQGKEPAKKGCCG